MVLRRLGNKAKLASEIIKYFPKHDIYIELFFGAGGIFHNKPYAKHNFLNDIDNDIFNLYQVLQGQKDELLDAVISAPVHESLFKYWLNNYESEPVKKALRFLYLSNYSLFGASTNIRVTTRYDKQQLIDKIIKNDFPAEIDIKFLNTDFRNVLKIISFTDCAKPELENRFIYADAPYLSTNNNYSSDKFTESDVDDLFEILVNSGIKFAMSEFDNEYILSKVKQYDLNYYAIKERRNLHNRKTEILVTNYTAEHKIFDEYYNETKHEN